VGLVIPYRSEKAERNCPNALSTTYWCYRIEQMFREFNSEMKLCYTRIGQPREHAQVKISTVVEPVIVD
jgi:hypothetical protein